MAHGDTAESMQGEDGPSGSWSEEHTSGHTELPEVGDVAAPGTDVFGSELREGRRGAQAVEDSNESAYTGDKEDEGDSSASPSVGVSSESLQSAVESNSGVNEANEARESNMDLDVSTKNNNNDDDEDDDDDLFVSSGAPGEGTDLTTDAGKQQRTTTESPLSLSSAAPTTPGTAGTPSTGGSSTLSVNNLSPSGNVLTESPYSTIGSKSNKGNSLKSQGNGRTSSVVPVQGVTSIDFLDDDDDEENDILVAPVSMHEMTSSGRKQDSLMSDSATSQDDDIDYDEDSEFGSTPASSAPASKSGTARRLGGPGNSSSLRNVASHGAGAKKKAKDSNDGFEIGFVEDKNKRYRRTMEDTHTILRRFGDEPGCGYFAIFDGHAGKSAAEYVGDNLHDVLLSIQRAKPEGTPMQEIISEAFAETDKKLCSTNGIFSGCTAVIAVVRYEEREDETTGETKRVRVLYAANAGDARAVLSRESGAVRLTYDHKGSDSQEAQRVVEAGAFVMNGRVNGVLAVTRSFGDVAMKEWVISAPYISETVLDEKDDILILACDGLWDVSTDSGAVDLIKNEPDAQKAAEMLLNFALENYTTDNLSVLVVKLV